MTLTPTLTIDSDSDYRLSTLTLTIDSDYRGGWETVVRCP